jgi:hypothetical protein
MRDRALDAMTGHQQRLHDQARASEHDEEQSPQLRLRAYVAKASPSLVAARTRALAGCIPGSIAVGSLR